MPNVMKSIVVAVSLFIIDAFVLNQGILSLVILFIAIPFMVVRAIKKREDSVLLKKRLIIMGIYVTMVVLVFASNHLNNVIAKNRADVIIKACEQYKLMKGVYPPKLSVLVPVFLKKIPTAKYTFSSDQFRYFVSANHHQLMFTAIPPFGRSYYVLEEKRWGSID
ncbi:MAG: hypothetical protein WCH07_08835 [Deltaproteobacteria bacterium]